MKTRKLLAVLLVAGMILALSACSGSSLSGKYVITDLIDDPEGLTFTDLVDMYKDMNLELADYLYLELRDGDRFTLVMFGEEEAKGTYTKDDDSTLTLNAEGKSTNATLSGNTITWTYENGGKLVFEKK